MKEQLSKKYAFISDSDCEILLPLYREYGLDMLTHKVQSRNHPVNILYQEELRCLNPIPMFQFDTSKTVVASVEMGPH